MTERCELCGEPMPAGEEMFKYHGYSGDCPKPPLPKPKIVSVEVGALLTVLKEIDHTLCVHRHMDADTALHEKIQHAIRSNE